MLEQELQNKLKKLINLAVLTNDLSESVPSDFKFSLKENATGDQIACAYFTLPTERGDNHVVELTLEDLNSELSELPVDEIYTIVKGEDEGTNEDDETEAGDESTSDENPQSDAELTMSEKAMSPEVRKEITDMVAKACDARLAKMEKGYSELKGMMTEMKSMMSGMGKKTNSEEVPGNKPSEETPKPEPKTDQVSQSQEETKEKSADQLAEDFLKSVKSKATNTSIIDKYLN